MARPTVQSSQQPAHRRGLVRLAKRPPGWVAPGPKPAGPGTRDDLWPDEGEDLCYLLGDWRIFQRLDGHRWSLDDLVTAWVAKRAMSGQVVERIFDLGCGIGSVLLMHAFCWPDADCVGVEAQTLSYELAARSLAYNGATARVSLRHGDLRDRAVTGDGRVFDLVTGTPPYFPTTDGTVSERPQKGPCRFELRGGVEAYLEAAARLLAPNGRFVVCETSLAHARVVAGARAMNLYIHEKLDVVGRVGKQPLICVYTLGWDDRGSPREAALTVRDRRGQWMPKFRELREEMALPGYAQPRVADNVP